MKDELPEPMVEFKRAYPEVWKAFSELGEKCHEAGPLDERSRRLAKLGLAIGAGLEGATHSAVRLALRSGVTAEEIGHVVALATTTLGFPATVRAWTWVRDVLDEGADDRP